MGEILQAVCHVLGGCIGDVLFVRFPGSGKGFSQMLSYWVRNNGRRAHRDEKRIVLRDIVLALSLPAGSGHIILYYHSERQWVGKHRKKALADGHFDGRNDAASVAAEDCIECSTFSFCAESWRLLESR